MTYSLVLFCVALSIDVGTSARASKKFEWLFTYYDLKYHVEYLFSDDMFPLPFKEAMVASPI